MYQICRIFILLFFLNFSSFADEYVVVSNKNMKDLNLLEIRAIFLKKITLVDDIKVVPINLEAGDDLRLKFEAEVLKMSFLRLKTYWTKEHYLGHRPPISVKSQESIKAFLHKVDGAIGYMQAQNVDENMKIIYTWRD